MPYALLFCLHSTRPSLSLTADTSDRRRLIPRNSAAAAAWIQLLDAVWMTLRLPRLARNDTDEKTKSSFTCCSCTFVISPTQHYETETTNSRHAWEIENSGQPKTSAVFKVLQHPQLQWVQSLQGPQRSGIKGFHWKCLNIVFRSVTQMISLYPVSQRQK